MKLRTALVLGLAAVSVAACAQRTRPPGEPGVCYHVVQGADGKLKYNRLAGSQPTLENCAAELEGMRIRFLRMGGNQRKIVGAYQGNFLFLQREGIFTGPTLEGHRYLALVRTGDGRLAIPGAVAMPPEGQ
ncbi:MAG: hypothetical protein ACK41C_14180 [Phenylobacterium sp.]|uniref:hypothetical protein n=1 Tax=Phenylobacterium sp. TaxID=1871053 RepID=UPI00391C611E